MNSHLPPLPPLTSNVNPWFKQLLANTQNNAHLYMVIDAAQDERIFPYLHSTSNLYCCLFSENDVSPEVAAAAPYLIKVRHYDEFMAWCLAHGLARHWLLFFTSAQEQITEIRLHLKRFSLVTTADRREYLFRYYDPRVMPGFIAASTATERAKLFQAVEHFYLPSVGVDQTVQLTRWHSDGTQQVLELPARATPISLNGSWAAEHSAPQSPLIS